MRDKISLFICFSITTIIILTLNSCSAHNEYKLISREYLSALSTPDGYHAFVVIPMSDDEVYVVNVTLLLYTYKHCYKSEYSSETDFLVAMYSNEIKDIKQKFQSCTGYNIKKDISKIDMVIMNEYKNYGLKFIKQKYLNEIDKESFEFKEFISETILKIMFMNNYYLYQHETYFSFTKDLIHFPSPSEVES